MCDMTNRTTVVGNPRVDPGRGTPGPGRMPGVADRHTAALWTAGGALISVGGIFMTVTGFEPTKKPSIVWANSWFDLGFAFVVLGALIVAAGVVMHFRREVQPGSALPAVNATAGPAAATPPAVNPDEFKPYHAESGEFPDDKALTFGFDHITDHPAAYMALSPRRCTVITPSGATTNVTRHNRYFQYPKEFENVPPVRPGLYRFRLEGQLANGEWVDITSGEHEVQPPPKTGLEVVIEDEKRTPFSGLASILEIEYCIANHDPVPHELRRAIRGVNPVPLPSAGDPAFMAVLREEHAIRQRRHRDKPLPARVQPGETVHGVYITTFPWDPTGKFPDYTLVIRDERNVYTARPHGAGGNPLVSRS